MINNPVFLSLVFSPASHSHAKSEQEHLSSPILLNEMWIVCASFAPVSICCENQTAIKVSKYRLQPFNQIAQTAEANEQPSNRFANESTHSRKTGVGERNIHIEAGQCFSGRVNNWHIWHRSVKMWSTHKKQEKRTRRGIRNTKWRKENWIIWWCIFDTVSQCTHTNAHKTTKKALLKRLKNQAKISGKI